METGTSTPGRIRLASEAGGLWSELVTAPIFFPWVATRCFRDGLPHHPPRAVATAPPPKAAPSGRTVERRALSPRVELLVHGVEAALVDVGVDLGGGDVGVAEEFLDDAEVGAAAEQVGGEAVA